jgi:hypothetical protein
MAQTGVGVLLESCHDHPLNGSWNGLAEVSCWDFSEERREVFTEVLGGRDVHYSNVAFLVGVLKAMP